VTLSRNSLSDNFACRREKAKKPVFAPVISLAHFEPHFNVEEKKPTFASYQKSTHHMKKILLFILTVAILTSCSEGITKKYVIENIDITVEGPLFDGPNTMQATHGIDLSQIETGLLSEQIQAVKMTKATITTADSAAFNSVRNFVLQFTAADAKMQKAGVLNPVPQNSSTVELTPSAEAELLDNFKQQELIIILDADLEGDRDENLTYTGTFEFEITYKK